MSSVAGERGSEAGGSAVASAVVGPGHVGFVPSAVRVASTGVARVVVGAVRVLAAVDVSALSDDECLGVFDDIELACRSLTAAASGVLAEIDGRDLCDVRYGSSTGVWFERRHGRSRAGVAREVRRARKLWSVLPVVAAALARGEISGERVELIVGKVNDRTADGLRAAQAGLLALSAAEPSYAQFAVLVADLARLADEDGTDPGEVRSRAHLGRTGDELVVRAVYAGVDAVGVEQLIESATNRLWRRWRRDCGRVPGLEMPSRAELRAAAIAELIRRGAAADPADARATVAELSLVVDADRVDDLDPLLAGVLDGTGVGSGVGGVRSHRFDGDSGSCCGGVCGAGRLVGVPVSTPDGTRVRFTAAQWQLLVCNADISEVLLDRLGMPVAVRERLRSPNRVMRRALHARDGGCVFPGCDGPPGWCDAHHVVEWDRDGDTVTVNLVLLCRRHHGIVHRTGWSIRRNTNIRLDDRGHAPAGPAPDGGGLFVITTADGLELHTRHRHRPDHPNRHRHRQPEPV